MSNFQSANDFLMAEGGKSFPFETIGDTVRGTIVSAEVRQQTDVETGAKLSWADGSPRNQLVITLQTQLHNDDNDDGVRAVYAKGGKYDIDQGEGLSMKDAIAMAVKDAGGSGLNPGDELAVSFTGLGIRKNRAFNAPKLYVAGYKAAPAPSVSARDLFGEMAAAE